MWISKFKLNQIWILPCPNVTGFRVVHITSSYYIIMIQVNECVAIDICVCALDYVQITHYTACIYQFVSMLDSSEIFFFFVAYFVCLCHVWIDAFHYVFELNGPGRAGPIFEFDYDQIIMIIVIKLHPFASDVPMQLTHSGTIQNHMEIMRIFSFPMFSRNKNLFSVWNKRHIHTQEEKKITRGNLCSDKMPYIGVISFKVTIKLVNVCNVHWKASAFKA